MLQNRKDNRQFGSIRPISYKLNPFGYSHASIFFEQGQTKVYVSLSLQHEVPKFLRGSGTGWLTCEYSMHPHSTDQGRTQREASAVVRNFRNIEISRLIGRSLRSIIDFKALREQTIYVDCDVLQADGGTRTACLTAASIALQEAQKVWLAKGSIKQPVLRTRLAAVSVGMVEGRTLLDLDQKEDQACDADFNFVLTENQMIVEVQGTAEKYPLAWAHFDEFRKLATQGIEQIFQVIDANAESLNQLT